MPYDEMTKQRALEWAVRAGDSDFGDWEAFTQWLEADPAHARAYDEVTAAVADAADIANRAPQPANDDVVVPRPTARRRWAIGALAASLALAVGLGLTLAGNGRYAVETAPGEIRNVALADGGSLVLSGGTRLELDRDDHRFARLERGQALFTIKHDEQHPFVVLVGDDRLVDAGTVFDVAVNAQSMQVAVSEGLVLLNPGKQDVKVSPGRILTKRQGAGSYTLAPVAPDQVGEWRSGRLTFDEASLGAVAERLSRMTGVPFAAKAGSGGGAFSGSVLIAPLRKDPQSLGALLGVTVRREGDRWIISAE